MSSSLNLDNYEFFHRSVGWIQQSYYFFFSCLPRETDEFPKNINGINFQDFNHVKIYENELSYSFTIRIFGALEELCNNLKLEDRDIPQVIKNSSSLSEKIKTDYSHLRKLRHVITHGNGDGEVIRNKYVNYTKDHNGDLLIKIEELEGFVNIIVSIAKELNSHANHRT